LVAESVMRRLPPAQSIQLGERRRVVESVPLGNMVSNHLAKARLNALENAYDDWALACASTGSLTHVAQESPYLLVARAAVRFGRATVENAPRRYRFGVAFSVADVPESASGAAARGADDTLLGPRIPAALDSVWQLQNRSADVDTPDTILARPCTS